MLDTVRRYVEAGREALTPKKAEELARALIEQGQARADQAGRIAKDLIDWSLKSSERLRETIRHEVQKQMSKAGVASKDEVDALKRRIRELESQSKAKAPAAKATTQRSAAGSKPGGRTSSRTATAGRPKSETAGATRVPRRKAGGRASPRGTTRRSSPPGSTRG
jgi:polyhydroxyalkanoate synthesis regulator phasin